MNTHRELLKPSQKPTAVPVKRGKTDHAVAMEYAKRGWGKFKSRSDWEDSLRYKGQFTLPQPPKTNETNTETMDIRTADTGGD